MPVNMKSLIAEQYIELAKRNGADQITVKALVAACHISRQTFYYHFRDLMDVIQWSMQQEMRKTVVKCLELRDPEEALRLFITTVSGSRALFDKLLNSRKRAQIEQITVQAIRTYLQEMTRGGRTRLNGADLDFCTYGILGLLMENCSQQSLTQARLVRQMLSMLPGGMAREEEPKEHRLLPE